MSAWLGELRARSPASPLWGLVFYAACRYLLAILYTLFFRARAFGKHNVPQRGACLIVANHQSFLDPPLIGLASGPRHADYVARSGLFSFGPFGAILGGLNAIPIREDQGDAGAIREVLKRLEQGRSVVIFPEGSRCDTGEMEAFKRGVAVLVKRAGCPVVPAAVEGCFDAFPNSTAFPRIWGCPVAVMYAKPISHDELMAGGADAALRRLEREIDAVRLVLRGRIRAWTHGTFPARGRADKARFGVGALRLARAS